MKLTEITRGWPQERRKKQAENCRKTKPWQQNTGPKTDAGKEESAQNALKHGFRSADYKKLRAVLKRHKTFLKAVAESNIKA